MIGWINLSVESFIRESFGDDVWTQLIAKARIPIVKFEEADSGFAFDVSFDVANGPAAAEWMREQMAALPPLRPLSLVLKAFLQQRCGGFRRFWDRGERACA